MQRTKIGDIEMWGDDNTLYIKTPDGIVTGLSQEQANQLLDEIKEALASTKDGDFVKLEISIGKYGPLKQRQEH